MAKKVINSFKPNLKTNIKKFLSIFKKDIHIEKLERLKFKENQIKFKKASEPSDINWTGIGSLISKRKTQKESNKLIIIQLTT